MQEVPLCTFLSFKRNLIKYAAKEVKKMQLIITVYNEFHE